MKICVDCTANLIFAQSVVPMYFRYTSVTMRPVHGPAATGRVPAQRRTRSLVTDLAVQDGSAYLGDSADFLDNHLSVSLYLYSVEGFILVFLQSLDGLVYLL